MTHYIPAFAKVLGVNALAVCGRYVDYASDADRPSCEDCRRLIAAEDKDREAVSIAEVVERY